MNNLSHWLESTIAKKLTSFLTLFYVVFTLTGCGSSNRITNGWGRTYEADFTSSSRGQDHYSPDESRVDDLTNDFRSVNDTPRFDLPVEGDGRQIESILRAELDSWMGVPYVLGGTSKRGIDCSALVQQVYAKALNIQTPRTTESQLRTGSKVSVNALRTGDLVFFQPSKNYRHVGIYLRDGDFAHASSSRGVMISNLSEPYWTRSYTTARRLIESPGKSYTASNTR